MNLKTYLFLLPAAFTLHASAQFTEHFNSRPGIARTDVRNFLQASCWNFSSFVCSNKPSELIEGDGSLLSVPPVNAAIPSGIYSPLLDMQSNVSVSFKYRFLTPQPPGSLIKIYLANAANEPEVLLDSVAAANDNAMLGYSRTFETVRPGTYKLFIQYSHVSADSRLVIDDIAISAAMHYPGGCNSAPVANEDMVLLDNDGVSNSSITSNDIDSDNDQFVPLIESGSADGIVELTANNNVVFKANPGFKGGATEFSYRICETSGNGLCSEPAKVIVQVPKSQASALVEFTGEYQQAGNIGLHWRTSSAHSTSRFNVERSLDGKSWQLAGTVVAAEKDSYVFNDRVRKNTANRNDIYYRIKEVLKNEAVITSKLLVLRVYNSAAVRMVSVSPNPEKNDINVTLQLNQPSITSMKVVNSAGDEVFRKTVKTAGEVNNILLDGTSKLEPGEYTLDVIINSKERMFVSLLKD
ncbi:MAG TPA: Ig-like domain-containing protein [Flavitalea sp.]|nr:Ig-like domain-containing protein [Flavitalea sp.]